MSDPLAWIDDEAAAWTRQGLTRRLVSHGAVTPGRFVRDGRTVLNFGSNDYLGLAADPRLIDAAQRAAEQYGWGAGASALVAGWTDAHEQLTAELAAFERAEAAQLFPSGFAANMGAVAALVGPGDAVYVDRLNHACLVDGARLAGARLRVYPHNDAERLAAILDRDQGRFRRRLIATDGVFSMDGDLAPLDRLVDLAEHHDAMLLVDEAHGTGVFGPDGRGAASECGVADRVPIRVGTLSKALGSIGGFVAGSRRLIDWLTNHARTQIYSTALPAAAAAAASEALRIVTSEPERRQRLRTASERLRAALDASGWTLGPARGPILPVLLGDAARAVALSRRLAEAGLFVPAIRPPTVPANTARLRVSLTAAHSDHDLEQLVEALMALAEDGPSGSKSLV